MRLKAEVIPLTARFSFEKIGFSSDSAELPVFLFALET